MSTPGRAPLRAFARRRAPRCSLAVPVRVTVLRAGAAYSIPGRSVDLGEGGIAVVLAGEVRVSDVAGVEFLLPDLGLGLQTKAVVRHHSPMRCGFEFTELTRHQQAVIREWARQKLQAKPAPSAPPSATPAPRTPSLARAYKLAPDWEKYRRFAWIAIAVLTLIGLLLWWNWERGWKEIEEKMSATTEWNSASPDYLAAISRDLPTKPNPS